jgi:hypothetical protein
MVEFQAQVNDSHIGVLISLSSCVTHLSYEILETDLSLKFYHLVHFCYGNSVLDIPLKRGMAMSIFALSSIPPKVCVVFWVIDKARHRTIKYLQGEKQACVLVNRSQCRKLECISEVDTYYEVELVKAKIRRFKYFCAFIHPTKSLRGFLDKLCITTCTCMCSPNDSNGTSALQNRGDIT